MPFGEYLPCIRHSSGHFLIYLLLSSQSPCDMGFIIVGLHVRGLRLRDLHLVTPPGSRRAGKGNQLGELHRLFPLHGTASCLWITGFWTALWGFCAGWTDPWVRVPWTEGGFSSWLSSGPTKGLWSEVTLLTFLSAPNPSWYFNLHLCSHLKLLRKIAVGL